MLTWVTWVRTSTSTSRAQTSQLWTVRFSFNLFGLVLNRLNDFNTKIGDLENQMNLMKAFSGGSSADGGKSGAGGMQAIMDALNQMNEKLRRDMNTTFARQTEVDRILKRLEDLEELTKDHDKEIQKQEVRQTQCRDITDQNSLDINDLKNALA